MKKYLILLLLITISSYSQRGIKSVRFDYLYSITPNNIFSVTYLNQPYLEIGTNTSITSWFQLECQEDYLNFLCILYKFGNTPAHLTRESEIRDTSVNTITGILQDSHPFVLILDSNGGVWKFTKPKALQLFNELNNPIMFNRLRICGCDENNILWKEHILNKK